MKPIAQIWLGNPKDDPTQNDLSKSESDSPITCRLEGLNSTDKIESKIEFDLDGNGYLIFLKDYITRAQNFVAEFEQNVNIKSKEELKLSSVQFVIESTNFILNVTQNLVLGTNKKVTISADEETDILSPNILLGKLTKDILNLEGNDYDLAKNYDAILTLNKFIKFFTDLIIPFINEVISLREAHNTHLHSGVSTGQEVSGPPDTLVNTSNSENAKNIGDLTASLTTKCL